MVKIESNSDAAFIFASNNRNALITMVNSTFAYSRAPTAMFELTYSAFLVINCSFIDNSADFLTNGFAMLATSGSFENSTVNNIGIKSSLPEAGLLSMN